MAEELEKSDLLNKKIIKNLQNTIIDLICSKLI